jgi:hypothetical protein
VHVEGDARLGMMSLPGRINPPCPASMKRPLTEPSGSIWSISTLA